jgi:hypothetical protein
VVEGRRRRLANPRRAARITAGGLCLLMVVAVFGLVALHVVSAQKQFEIDRLATEEQQAQTTYENLRLQVDQLDTPQHILGEAAKLGMVQPHVVTFLPGAVTLAPGSAGTAPSGASDWTKMKPVLAGNP